jgi:hypothetical protein
MKGEEDLVMMRGLEMIECDCYGTTENSPPEHNSQCNGCGQAYLGMCRLWGEECPEGFPLEAQRRREEGDRREGKRDSSSELARDGKTKTKREE